MEVECLSPWHIESEEILLRAVWSPIWIMISTAATIVVAILVVTVARAILVVIVIALLIAIAIVAATTAIVLVGRCNLSCCHASDYKSRFHIDLGNSCALIHCLRIKYCDTNFCLRFKSLRV